MNRRHQFSALCAAVALGFSALAAPAMADDDEERRQELIDQQKANEEERKDLSQIEQDNKDRIEELQSTLEGVDVELQDAYLALETTRQEIPIAEANLAAAQERLAEAQRNEETVAGQLVAAEAELVRLDEEIATQSAAAETSQRHLGELARANYRGESPSPYLQLISGADSAEEFLEAYSVQSSVSRTQFTILQEAQESAASARNHRERQTAVELEIERLHEEAEALVIETQESELTAQERANELLALEEVEEQQAADLEGKRAEFEQSLQAVEEEQASTATRIAEIDKENHALAAEQTKVEDELARKAAEAKRIAEEAAKKKAEEERAALEAQRIANEQAKKAAEAKAAEKAEQERLAQQRQVEADAKKAAAEKAIADAAKAEEAKKQADQDVEDNKAAQPPAPPASTSAFIPPVPAPVYVTSPFGMRWYPITGGYFMHQGVDLRSTCGSPQWSSAPGTVQSVRGAAGNGTHGNQVFVNHGIINGSSYVTVYNHLSGFAVSQGQPVGQGTVIGYTGMTGAVTGCHVHFEVWRDGRVIDPMSMPGFY